MKRIELFRAHNGDVTSIDIVETIPKEMALEEWDGERINQAKKLAAALCGSLPARDPRMPYGRAADSGRRPPAGHCQIPEPGGHQ